MDADELGPTPIDGSDLDRLVERLAAALIAVHDARVEIRRQSAQLDLAKTDRLLASIEEQLDTQVEHVTAAGHIIVDQLLVATMFPQSHGVRWWTERSSLTPRQIRYLYDLLVRDPDQDRVTVTDGLRIAAAHRPLVEWPRPLTPLPDSRRLEQGHTQESDDRLKRSWRGAPSPSPWDRDEFAETLLSYFDPHADVTDDLETGEWAAVAELLESLSLPYRHEKIGQLAMYLARRMWAEPTDEVNEVEPGASG